MSGGGKCAKCGGDCGGDCGDVNPAPRPQPASALSEHEISVVNGFVWAVQALSLQGQATVAHFILSNAIMALEPGERKTRLEGFMALVAETVALTMLAEAEPQGRA